MIIEFSLNTSNIYMLPLLKLTGSVKENASLVVILRNAKEIAKIAGLTEEEKKFAGKQIAEKKNPVILNQYSRIIAVYNIEDKKEPHLALEAARKAGDSIVAALNRYKIENVTVSDESGRADIVLALTEGMMLGNYQFLKYRKEAEKEKNALKEISLKGKKITSADISNLGIVCDAVYRARDLVNEPQNSQTATQLGQAFAKMGREAGFKVEVMNKAKIQSLKMGGLLAVNLGSKEPPTFTVMEWKPANARNKKPIVLVGKGVVYDTGGLSLKPTPNSMDYMKCDMGGAAAVGCAMYAVAKAKLPMHIIALVPSTDNRLSETAYAPGDVITMMSGQTVEVLNTDAEGRVILADALHYAKRYEPQLVMEFSTLTGSAAVAIGTFGMVCMGTAADNVRKKMNDAANKVYERLAEFPFWDEYDELIKSDIADMKNIGGPAAGAITAGKFLQRFTDYPCMHFDIAGPAFLHTPSSYRGKGGTGIGVRFLFEFLSGK
jgi:leucyl aminopeptidase